MPLIRIVYFSENRLGLVRRHSKIAELQAVAIARNGENEITGALVYDDEWFVQVLEGEAQMVEATMQRIAKDPRHANVAVISRKPISERRFGKWSMGFAERNPRTEVYFGEHWFNGGMNPHDMKDGDVLNLMDRLAKDGFMH